MKIAFDIGGWISRYPDLTREMMACLERGGAEVIVMTDMPCDTSHTVLAMNDFIATVHFSSVVNVDWNLHKERSKAEACREHGVDLLIDDYAPYCVGDGFAALMVWPKHEHPYDAAEWIKERIHATITTGRTDRAVASYRKAGRS